MNIIVDQRTKRVQIWVDYAQKDNYKQNSDYQAAVKKYKHLSYTICVYIGGNEPILPNITALLGEQNQSGIL